MFALRMSRNVSSISRSENCSLLSELVSLKRVRLHRTIAELLDTFARLRSQNLRELQMLNLTPELLEKRGTHPELGTVTLKQLLATWVVHDLGHIRQVARVMAKQYKEEVGPWTVYLPVLTRD